MQLISKKCKSNSKRKRVLQVSQLEQKETGFAIVEDGIIKEFKEKPVMKLQLSECLGIYMLGADIIKRIKTKSKQKEINLSLDILQ